MNIKKIITMGLTAVITITSVSIPTFADDSNEVIYSYIDTNNNEVNITQAELDAEHWDKNELGSNAPFVYEDFPMYINSFVDDYSDMSFDLTYLKNLDAADCVYLTITDLSDDVIIYNEQLNQNTVSVPDIEVNTTYQLTISETFDGVTTEYNKAVVTSIETPELPDYITNAETEDETIILVGDVDDLRASVVVDEDGNEEIVDDMPRYVQVNACDFADYVSNLAEDKLYRIYTHSKDDKIYVGFISTAGDIDGIFMPSIKIYKWDTYTASLNKPRKAMRRNNGITPLATTPSSQLTSSQILNSTIIDINNYRDYEIIFDTTERDFQAYRFKVPADYEDIFSLKIRANDSVTVEIWSLHSGASSLTYETLYWNSNGNINLSTLMHFMHGQLYTDDYVYFAVYFNGDVVTGEGTISIQDTDADDDVTGSAYQAYQDFLNGNYTQYTTWTPFTILDERDVDTFFLTYGTSSKKNYVRVRAVDELEDSGNYNGKYTHLPKYVEVSYTPANESIFYTTHAPSDVYTMGLNTPVSFNKTSTIANKKFISIYNVSGGNGDDSYYIYLLKRYNY